MAKNIKTIKVGTFNLMNFMLPDKPVYGGSLSYSKAEFQRKSNWIRFMLDEMDADIIGFQELFHKEAMMRVIRDDPRYKNARLFIAEETGDQPSVAILSRFPIENIEVFSHYPEEAIIDFNPKGRDRVELPFTTFTRPVLKADVRIPDYGIITFFVVHLKSKREIFYVGESQENPVDLAKALSRSLILRSTEAVAARALVAHSLEIPERPVILCGDVNDTGNAVTSRIISGEVPEHRLADDVKHRIWDLLLYHVKDIQARRSYQDFYYTHIHNGMYESLDHLMVSQELVTEYPRNTGRVGLVSVFNDHLVDRTFTDHGADKCKSDHGVVVCSIELDLDRAARYIPKEDISVSNYTKCMHDLDEDSRRSRRLERRRANRDSDDRLRRESLAPKTENVDNGFISGDFNIQSAQEADGIVSDEAVSNREEEHFDMNRTLDRWMERRSKGQRNDRSGRGDRRDNRKIGTRSQERSRNRDDRGSQTRRNDRSAQNVRPHTERGNRDTRRRNSRSHGGDDSFARYIQEETAVETAEKKNRNAAEETVFSAGKAVSVCPDALKTASPNVISAQDDVLYSPSGRKRRKPIVPSSDEADDGGEY